MDGFLDSFSKELHPDWKIHLVSTLPGGIKTDYLKKSVVFTDRHPAYLDPSLPTNHVQAVYRTPNIADLYPEPENLVKIVVETVKNGIGELGIPSRLPLGADSWTMLKTVLERSLTELEILKETSLSTGVSASALGVLADKA
jgi:hypothetical protein